VSEERQKIGGVGVTIHTSKSIPPKNRHKVVNPELLKTYKPESIGMFGIWHVFWDNSELPESREAWQRSEAFSPVICNNNLHAGTTTCRQGEGICALTLTSALRTHSDRLFHIALAAYSIAGPNKL
jgi:hypothetical protein